MLWVVVFFLFFFSRAQCFGHGESPLTQSVPTSPNAPFWLSLYEALLHAFIQFLRRIYGLSAVFPCSSSFVSARSCCVVCCVVLWSTVSVLFFFFLLLPFFKKEKRKKIMFKLM